MAYTPFKHSYNRTQQPPKPEVDKRYIDEEFQKLQRALKELTDKVKELQALVPNP